MTKAKLQPLFFEERNDEEEVFFAEQMARLKDFYGGIVDFLEAKPLGSPAALDADAILFPQMIFAAYRHDEMLRSYGLPMVVMTSPFGTVEMWDWEIITYLRDLGLTVFSPYSVEIGETILRALSVKRSLKDGAKFLIFQDTPGEGMQAEYFKRFYWWEKKSTASMEATFGCRIIYQSWKALSQCAREIPDDEARRVSADWNIHQENVSESCFLKAVKIYIAVKRVIAEIGGVAGVGANCLNESFHCDTTPCLAWNMLFERDDILFACEGDTLSLLSTYILYRALERPLMMTNLYPFLVGMAALAHEKIDRFPDIEDPDHHALGVHCGYFGLVARRFCDQWTLRPKVLGMVNDDAIMVDARLPKGPVTLAKINPGFKTFSIIKAELEDYVQYPGSDCRNGALLRYRDGHKVMDALSSHHSLILQGDVIPHLRQLSRVFGWDTIEL